MDRAAHRLRVKDRLELNYEQTKQVFERVLDERSNLFGERLADLRESLLSTLEDRFKKHCGFTHIGPSEHDFKPVVDIDPKPGRMVKVKYSGEDPKKRARLLAKLRKR